jgi:hypothetical protein
MTGLVSNGEVDGYHNPKIKDREAGKDKRMRFSPRKTKSRQ